MIRQAGLRPSCSSRTSRRSSASASLNGTATVRSATCCGTPPPYGNDGISSGSTSSPVAAFTGRPRDTDGDHHAVVVPVVRAEDLHDRVAPLEAARDPDRVHRRLGARVREAPLGQPEAPRQLLRDDDPVLGRRREVRPQPGALGDRLDDRRMRVAHDHRAEAVVEVPELAAVDVPDARALRRARGRSATGRARGTRTERRAASPRARARTCACDSCVASSRRFASRSVSSLTRSLSICAWTTSVLMRVLPPVAAEPAR